VALLIQTKINGLGLAYVAGVAAAKGLYSIAFALEQSSKIPRRPTSLFAQCGVAVGST
jgi:hypothetical protein